ncbi:MAG TPA: hypothetical protein VFI27_22955 [candidate division Zixibacteria bacterium]|nr:hypothetical protein [candidate division Zixibacteria bacterium]
MSGEKQESSRNGISGLVFVGCLMIGLAIGLLTENVAVALLGGLGVGFIAMAIARYVTREW